MKNKHITFEQKYVHDFYNLTAIEFNKTRQKPLPIVSKFIESLPKYSLIADVGCGNGRNMKIDKNKITIGLEKSRELAKITKKKNNEILLGDNICLPFRDNAYDAVLSIAVIQHFSSHERRMKAISEIIRITNINGLIMLSVWLKNNDKQKDVIIPWYDTSKNININKYFYLFDNNELETMIKEFKNVVIIDTIYEYDNYYMIIKKLSTVVT